MRLAVLILSASAGCAAFGQSPAPSLPDIAKFGQLPPEFTQRTVNFGRFQPQPFQMALAQKPAVGVVPIPTQWPNARVEPIPTRWPNVKVLPIEENLVPPMK
jgi:hypothetical protein